jgi:hypothetical protein
MDLQSYADQLSAMDSQPAAVRSVYAAAHIVVNNESGNDINWQATAAQRIFLDNHGFGIAEAMDTAQRFELGWDIAKQLITSTASLKLENGFAAGASADHIAATDDLDALATAVAWQVNFIAQYGGLPVILPITQLSLNNASADDYVKVYSSILEQSESPVLLHWLGEMFLPSLANYFPGDSFERIMHLDEPRILGVKISLLNQQLEVDIRARLAQSKQVVYTGDDFNFAQLIAGDDQHYSHALLGIFDGIARPAGLALQFLARGKTKEYFELMKPCEALSRVIFEQPTQHYKAGLAYLAWLDQRQDNPWLPCAAHLQRDADYYARVLELGLAARVFNDPEAAQALASQRDKAL